MTGARGIRGLVALGVILAATLGLGGPANAGPPFVCALTSPLSPKKIDNATPATYKWVMTPHGTCAGGGNGPFAAKGFVIGTSQGLGLCDGSLLVQNLDLDVRLNLHSSKGPKFNREIHERWFAGTTTYPLVTPFLAENLEAEPGEPPLIGGGVIFNHILLNCQASIAALTLNLHAA